MAAGNNGKKRRHLIGKNRVFQGVYKENGWIAFGQMRQKPAAKPMGLVYFLQSPMGGYGKLNSFADEETIDFLPLY